MVATTAGWMGPVEVVEVEFDPRVLPFAELLARAEDGDCAQRVFTRTDAQQAVAARVVGARAERSDAAIRVVEDQKYWLAQTPLRYVPMTATQATRVNADVDRAREWLSPRQRAVLDAATARPGAGWEGCVGRDPIAAWPRAWARTVAR